MLWLKPVLKNCAKDFAPNYLTTYLVELAGLFHAFYDNCRVIDDGNPETTAFRLLICQRAKERIKKGLELIGVSAPEQM
jgi:arginyl-tRNA synthetase